MKCLSMFETSVNHQLAKCGNGTPNINMYSCFFPTEIDMGYQYQLHLHALISELLYKIPQHNDGFHYHLADLGG